jgi:hypothetical protein
MTYLKLVHTNPKLNEKTMWYRSVGETGEWYLATIWGPKGMISSVVHAVPKTDYTLLKTNEETEDQDEDEFF